LPRPSYLALCESLRPFRWLSFNFANIGIFYSVEKVT
jgi:hypothetical protein